MSAKTKITWQSDSCGVDSIHVNGPGMAKDTYLGHVTRIDGEWYFKQKDVEKPHGPYNSLHDVRQAALRIVNGEYV
jgi:hypothetical protein